MLLTLEYYNTWEILLTIIGMEFYIHYNVLIYLLISFIIWRVDTSFNKNRVTLLSSDQICSFVDAKPVLWRQSRDCWSHCWRRQSRHLYFRHLLLTFLEISEYWFNEKFNPRYLKKIGWHFWLNFMFWTLVSTIRDPYVKGYRGK